MRRIFHRGKRGQGRTRMNVHLLAGRKLFPCRALVNNPILFHEG
jgi:hypothetical protein